MSFDLRDWFFLLPLGLVVLEPLSSELLLVRRILLVWKPRLGPESFLHLVLRPKGGDGIMMEGAPNSGGVGFPDLRFLLRRVVRSVAGFGGVVPPLDLLPGSFLGRWGSPGGFGSFGLVLAGRLGARSGLTLENIKNYLEEGFRGEYLP